jgi:two-component system sensor histidine kinase CpxA
MKLPSSLFAKILAWFFLNLILVAAGLAVFLSFNVQGNLYAIFGRHGSNRMRTAGQLIIYDLSRLPRSKWPETLARHAAIHRVDFTLVLEDGSRFSSSKQRLPKRVKNRVMAGFLPKPPKSDFPPRSNMGPAPSPTTVRDGDRLGNRPGKRKSARAFTDARLHEPKPVLMMQTQNPKRYWTGIRLPPLSDAAAERPLRSVLLAGSDSITGHGFFFDPLPWIIVAAIVVFMSLLLWMPMVRHITRPLARMTRATEKIAKGRFDVSLNEPRADEIGRLATAINHMALRLAAYIKGQKRFLGDVAHELGSPIARIQFGLAALQQRIETENRTRIADIMEDVEHLSSLVNELLSFSKTDLQSEPVKLALIDLLPVVQAAVKRETTSSAQIMVSIDPTLSVVAATDLLTRALANLVRNAVRYAAPFGPIYIDAKKENHHIDLKISDNGPGVDETLLDQLFEPFFRPQLARDRDSGGVGLGLAIVKSCIEKCQGTVAARNTTPCGFAVTITLKGS